jgi:hypothetical protein
MQVWATEKTIRREIAEAPEKWFDEFAVKQPDDIRKFGDATNATLTYRVPAVLQAIEERRYFRKKTTNEIVQEAVAHAKGSVAA